MTQERKPSAPEERKGSSSTPPASTTSMSRNAILMSAGAAIALTVPPSIQAIANPITRTVISLVALVVVFGLGYLVIPKKR
jgi:hypothetical protein